MPDRAVGRYLFRGISEGQYETGTGLRPSKPWFVHCFKYDGTIRFDGGATYGESEHNAVLGHQMPSLPRLEGRGKYPRDAGISTTPVLDRAHHYALHGGKSPRGWVLTIDRDRLADYSIREYVVAEL